MWIVPVLCIATVEPEHIMRAFEMGAEGVFVAGCGEQCARENTAFWLSQRVAKVRKALLQLGMEPQRLQTFNLRASEEDPVESLDRFTNQIGELRLAAALQQEVKS
jgi:F420-non-reducing hydrogenase iron-sulfur subunit